MSAYNVLGAAIIVGTYMLPIPAYVKAGMCAGVSISVGWLIWYKLTTPLNGLLRLASRLAAGNLVPGPDLDNPHQLSSPFYPVHQSLVQMQIMLACTAKDIQNNVKHIHGATAGLVENSKELSVRTETQAANLEQTASAMEEISSTVEHSTTSVAETSQVFNTVRTLVQGGVTAVEATSATMHDIASASAKITGFIQLIEGISFQTNILALNAAVEAARAGVHGRGFAVVATEVRALSQRTSAAANEIKQLVQSADTSVAEGSLKVEQAHAQMQQIAQAIERVTTLLSEVTVASGEQRIGVAQIASAVNQLDTMTQQNATMVDQLASNTQDVKARVDTLLQLSLLFRITPNSALLTDNDALTLKQAAAQRLVKNKAFSLDRAIAAHERWKSTLREAAIYHIKLDANKIERDDVCELGCWLHGDGKKHQAKLEFTALVLAHKAFHIQASRVAKTINAGQTEKAQVMLEKDSAFYTATNKTLAAIHRLKRALS
jgi:methyl-accepting chemotaxis protein